jgi:hypothetical protein
LAEWLGSGLQSRLQQFESARRLRDLPPVFGQKVRETQPDGWEQSAATPNMVSLMDAKGAEALRQYIEARGLAGVEVVISPTPTTNVVTLDRWSRAVAARAAMETGPTAA